MRYLLKTFVVLCAVVPCCGCINSGPFFEPVAAFPDGAAGYKLVLGRVWTVSGPGTPASPSKKELFAANGRIADNVVSIDPKSAKKLGSIGGLGGLGEIDALPIQDSGDWLLITRGGGLGGTKKFSVVEPQSGRTLRSKSVVDEVANERSIASAVSPSGLSILTVGPNSAQLWDTRTGHEEPVKNVDALIALRQILLTQRNDVGKWWITDDLRYVVVVPDEYIRTGGAWRGSPTPMRVQVSGVEIDIQNQAVIFDRQNQTVDSFSTRRQDRPLAVKVVDGRITLLNEGDLARLDPNATDVQYLAASWNDAGNLILVRRTGLPVWLSAQPPPTFFLLEWSSRLGIQRSFDLSPEAVRVAIEGR